MRESFPRFLSEEEFRAFVQESQMAERVSDLVVDHFEAELKSMERALKAETPRQARERIERDTAEVRKLIKLNLSERLYYATEMLVFQSLSVAQGRPLKRCVVETLCNLFFLQVDQGVSLLRDGRGRKPALTWPQVTSQIRQQTNPVRLGVVADLLGVERGTLTRCYKSKGFKMWNEAVRAAKNVAK
jgi:hypothetical protein